MAPQSGDDSVPRTGLSCCCWNVEINRQVKAAAPWRRKGAGKSFRTTNWMSKSGATVQEYVYNMQLGHFDWICLDFFLNNKLICNMAKAKWPLLSFIVLHRCRSPASWGKWSPLWPAVSLHASAARTLTESYFGDEGIAFRGRGMFFLLDNHVQARCSKMYTL